jgi:hypothetical protein
MGDTLTAGGVAYDILSILSSSLPPYSPFPLSQTATKDNFSDAIVNPKVEKFMKEEAGSSLYPRLMRKIKFTAKKVGATVPDRCVSVLVSTLDAGPPHALFYTLHCRALLPLLLYTLHCRLPLAPLLPLLLYTLHCRVPLPPLELLLSVNHCNQQKHSSLCCDTRREWCECLWH